MGVSMLALIWLNSHLITGGVLSSFSSKKMIPCRNPDRQCKGGSNPDLLYCFHLPKFPSSESSLFQMPSKAG